jgi:hypothetical protein
MAFNDIYRLRIYQRLHNAQVVNVLHFVEDVALSGSGAQDLAEDFRDSMTATLRARASNQLYFEYVEVQSLVPYADVPAVATWPANTNGTQLGSCISGSLAEVVSVYTSRAGRRGKGRMYLAGVDTQQTTHTNGLWSAVQSDRTRAFATALAERYMQVPYDSSWALGVWSRATAGPTPPWPSEAFVRASSLVVRSTMRNQRRRQVGVGR